MIVGYHLSQNVYRDDDEDMTAEQAEELITAVAELCGAHGLHTGGSAYFVDEHGEEVRECEHCHQAMGIWQPSSDPDSMHTYQWVCDDCAEQLEEYPWE